MPFTDHIIPAPPMSSSYIMRSAYTVSLCT